MIKKDLTKHDALLIRQHNCLVPLWWLVVICFFSNTHALGFDLEGYCLSHRMLRGDAFIEQFPYDSYLGSVTFTDFTTLQSHRDFLTGSGICSGEDFLLRLAEKYFTIPQYQVKMNNLASIIAIGETYLGYRKKNPITRNELFDVIGYYVLGRVARELETELQEKKVDAESPQIQGLIQRLQKNDIYITVERPTVDKLREAVAQKKYYYIVDRVVSELCDTGHKVDRKTEYLLGPEFFPHCFCFTVKQNDSLLKKQVQKSDLQMKDFKKFYCADSSCTMNILALYDSTENADQCIGYAIWLRRPAAQARYFAYKDIQAKYRQSRKDRKVILTTTGGFTNGYAQPEGLTIEQGSIVNAVLMHDRHGLVIVHDDGGISVVNLKNSIVNLALSPLTVLTIDNPLDSLVAYSKLINWCKEKRATLFQTQLLVFSNKLQFDTDKARTELRERRLLALVRNNDGSLYHVIFDIPQKYYLGDIAKKIFVSLVNRNQRVEALLNLDVGSFNILNVFDETGALITSPQGQVPVERATNMITYVF